MQPLVLHVEGLHSFRSPVRVDLAKLGEHGLFGVFGPIGSGKSSLLDALTLALYGQVDRSVGRSRKGLVNHQSKRCEVRLRFKVGSQIWEAQRAYKAEPDGNASRIHSRLSQLVGGQLQVVADKEREVNERIEVLLGLNADDFMRAVVLPQGRFMQFLQLQGSDRRRMLQRIFRLEPFGEGLRSRVKREASALQARLERTLGELEGLGPGSPEDLQRAEEAAALAQLEAERAEAEHHELAREHRLAERAVRHHERLQAATEALHRHEATGEGLASTREALALARIARPVIRLAAELQRQQQELAEAAELHEQAEATHAEERARQIQAIDRRNERLNTRASNTALERQQDVLEAAIRQHDELLAVQQDLRLAAKKRSQLDKRIEQDEVALASLDAELEREVATRTALRARWSECAVTRAERERLQLAETSRIALEGAREVAKQIGGHTRETEAEIEAARAAVARIEQALQEGLARVERSRRTVEELHTQADALNSLSQTLKAAERAGLVQRWREALDEVLAAQARVHEAQRVLAGCEQEEAEAAGRALDTEQMAGVLATTLNGPCLVCGSEDHPHPAPPRDAADFLASVDRRARAIAQRQGAATALADQQARLAKAEATVRGHEARSPAGLTTPDALRACLDRAQKATEALDHAIRRREQSTRALQPGVDEARALVSRARAHLEGLLTQERRDLDELQRAKTEEGRAWGVMNEQLGTLTLFDLPRALREIAEKDQERERLEPLAEAAERQLERLQAQWDRRRESLALRKTERDRLGLEREGLDRRREALLAKLDGVDADPRAALARVREQLATAKRDDELAQKEVEDTTRRVLETARAQERSTTRHEAARNDLTRVAEQLERALAEAGFTEAPPPEAGLPGVDLQVRQREVDAWFVQQKALSLSLAQLGATDLPPTTPEAFRALTVRFDNADERRRTTNDTRIRSAETLARVQARTTRVAELATVERALSDRASRVAELSRLLRGDKFVEFVANDYLYDLVREASRHLEVLTRGRYALDLDDGGTFIVADLDAGGASRPASSLSGGETFLASLALALALSTQVQQHNAQALEFFFLDEGFGSLDPESLDRVMSAIEGLAAESRVIGLISHVEAVRERVPSRLELSCPRDGSGTRVRHHQS